MELIFKFPLHVVHCWYVETIDFCVLTLYFAALVNLYISFGSFFVDSSVFPICKIMSFANQNNFPSIYFFSWVIAWAAHASQC